MAVHIESIDKGALVIYTAYVLTFLGAFVLGRQIMAEQETRAAQDNLADHFQLPREHHEAVHHELRDPGHPR
jgi:hypothetical protein